MNLEFINKSSSYIGEVVSLNKDNWIVTFKCPQLDEHAEFTAIPIFNHTCELVPGDQIFVYKPNETFSDNLFYHPIAIRKFVGLKNNKSIVDLTDPERVFIEADMDVVIKSSAGIITVSNNSIFIQGNVTITGTANINPGYTGDVLDSNMTPHPVRNGIVYP